GLATLLATDRAARAEGALSPLAPRRSPFPGRAKRVLHIFAQGAPSHIDTWDPKPSLARYDGQVIPEVDGVGFASPFKFHKRGQSGIEVSEVFPKIGEQ